MVHRLKSTSQYSFYKLTPDAVFASVSEAIQIDIQLENAWVWFASLKRGNIVFILPFYGTICANS